MITLENIGKRFQSHWVFKRVNLHLEKGNAYVVLGANGIGKSTLLRIIAGMQSHSQGKVKYNLDHKEIPTEKIFRHISYCAPSMDLIEEMTLREFLQFHFTFKKIKKGYTIELIIEALGMQKDANKFIGAFSSGMKQRVKLAQAFFSETLVLLLDEPCTNLDIAGVALYDTWLQQAQSENRLILIASNDEKEYKGVTQKVDMNQFTVVEN